MHYILCILLHTMYFTTYYVFYYILCILLHTYYSLSRTPDTCIIAQGLKFSIFHFTTCLLLLLLRQQPFIFQLPCILKSQCLSAFHISRHHTEAVSECVLHILKMCAPHDKSSVPECISHINFTHQLHISRHHKYISYIKEP